MLLGSERGVHDPLIRRSILRLIFVGLHFWIKLMNSIGISTKEDY